MQLDSFKTTESFSIEFEGPAFNGHDIPAVALAQSLLALDGLASRMSQGLYGSNSKAEIKVKAGFRQGSFLVDLIIEKFRTDPLEASAAAVGTAAGVVAGLKSLIKLGKWALGKKVKVIEDGGETAPNTVLVENEIGQINSFNVQVVNVFNNQRTMSQLSRLTQTLDMPGAESIKIIDPSDTSDEAAATISKSERDLFRHEDGIVLTDNEAEVILEVIGAMLNGAPKGWTFSEGDDGIEFVASVEDETFLNDVRNRKIVLENGTCIRAIVRTVQKKNVRTRTERTIVDVREILPPED